jgi:lipoate-protein ligase B
VNSDKIASIGVAVKRWVSFHGFSLNYETDLKYFDLINPCGLVGKKMTTMAKVLGERVSKERLSERIIFYFKEVFKKEWEARELKDLIADRKFQIAD